MNRILKVEQQIAGDAAGRITIAENSYNELGQLKAKQLGGNLQQVDYSYNIRGWLMSINNPMSPGADLFAEQLLYNEEVSGVNDGMAQHNGNISGVVWFSGSTQGYGYTYDALDRLTAADYRIFAEGWNNSSAYEERGILYDLNGNIRELKRTNGSGVATSLAYAYSGNQLARVDGMGLGQSYQYDRNGNAITDGRNGFTLEYNELNLPSSVTKSDKLRYVYTAAGEKVRVDYNGTTQSYYCGNFIYKGDRSLDYVVNPEGLTRKTSSGYVCYFYLKDHLGNVRATFSRGAGGLAVADQKTDYYPFGLAYSYNATDKNRYLYNGKELQDQAIGGTPFGWYDYGARFYDPELGRWHSPDPLEQYESGYVYAGNSPILMNDPSGMWAESPSGGFTRTVVDPIGNIIYHDDKDNKIYRSPDGKMGRDGNVDGLTVVGEEKPGEDYHKGGYLRFNYYGDHQVYSSRGAYLYTIDKPLENCYIIEDVIFSITGLRTLLGLLKAPAILNDILKKCSKGNQTKGKTELWEKDGGMDQAIKDFKSLKPENVKQVKTDRGVLYTGTLKDGKSITVRPFSSDKRPTLEIRNPQNGRGVEIRYN